jgi:hypothetical protein
MEKGDNKVSFAEIQEVIDELKDIQSYLRGLLGSKGTVAIQKLNDIIQKLERIGGKQ